MTLSRALPGADVGVIVGRFQVYELHEGHRDLIESVAGNHHQVLIVLGSTPGVIGGRRNSLDYNTRSRMIGSAYPDATIIHLPDSVDDDAWSKELDRRIGETTEGRSVVLYGSRDGFIPAYSGEYPTIELRPRVQRSGTEIRKAVSAKVLNSAEFRLGVIYANYQRRPTVFPTVDCAVIKDDEGGLQILLGRKNTDEKGKWRFPGGFVDAEDASQEEAAARELYEEVKGISVHTPPTYVPGSSMTVDDWRYRQEDDCIKTTLWLFEYAHGGIEAGSDLDIVAWLKLKTLATSDMIQGHGPLLLALFKHMELVPK